MSSVNRESLGAQNKDRSGAQEGLGERRGTGEGYELDLTQLSIYRVGVGLLSIRRQWTSTQNQPDSPQCPDRGQAREPRMYMHTDQHTPTQYQ